MWSKITSHLGVWLGLEEERQMRSSCSLSMLHNPQMTIVRSSKSSDNLNKVCTMQEPTSRKSSVFTLRRSRNKEKKCKIGPNANGTDTATLPKADPLTQSWHSQAQVNAVQPQQSKNIFSFLRPARSRSNHGVEPLTTVVAAASTAPCTTAVDPPPRRRRPRSAHLDPNSLTPMVDDFPQQDVNQLYERIEKLGEGSYATVFKCESKIDGSIVALKEIKLQFQEGLPFTAIREASLLRTLRHANIVCLHDIYLKHNQLTFVFEYMKMDLSKYLESHPNGLDAMSTRLLVFQLLRGLDFCHRKKILHRDLKPQNLLLDGEGTLKLADFGLARAKSVPSRTYSNEVVTLWYRPPDVLLGNTEYTTSLDMWGVGCIFAEICTGQPLFPGQKDVTDQLDKIFSIRGLPDPTRWPEVLRLPHYVPSVYPSYKEMNFVDVNSQLSRLLRQGLDLLGKFLQLKPDERVSASAAMMHPYFQALPREILILPPTHSIYSLPQLRR